MRLGAVRAWQGFRVADFYVEMAALSTRLISEKGSSLTIRARDTASDPVTGSGAAEGTTRTMNGVVVPIDYRLFPESLVEVGDRMILVASAIEVGEKWIEGTDELAVVAVKEIAPDRTTLVLNKALVRG